MRPAAGPATGEGAHQERAMQFVYDDSGLRAIRVVNPLGVRTNMVYDNPHGGRAKAARDDAGPVDTPLLVDAAPAVEAADPWARPASQ
jgi:hypothetical protein